MHIPCIFSVFPFRSDIATTDKLAATSKIPVGKNVPECGKATSRSTRRHGLALLRSGNGMPSGRRGVLLELMAGQGRGAALAKVTAGIVPRQTAMVLSIGYIRRDPRRCNETRCWCNRRASVEKRVLRSCSWSRATPGSVRPKSLASRSSAWSILTSGRMQLTSFAQDTLVI
jgi:hypothetical protein